MRRGTWILAILGTMALRQGGFAADPNSDQPVRRDAVGTTRTSSAKAPKKPAADPRSKNYYDDLFADDSADGSSNKKTASSSARSQDSSDDAAAESPKMNTGKKVAAQKDKATPPGKVSQADLKMPQGKKNNVQQVRSDGRPRSAPPVDGAEVPFNAQTRKPPVRERIVSEPITRTEEPKPAASSSMATTQNGPQTPQVTVEWQKRGEFNVGQECLVDLVVRNSGSAPVGKVAVDAFFPTNVRLTAAEPNPDSATDRLTWTFEQMSPGAENKMTVKMIPSQRGDINASAHVRFTGTGTGVFAVNEPLLKVSLKTPPKEIMLGDPASQMITVTNPGTGTAQDVKIEAKLSEGLEHPSREDHLIIDVGSVGPGETRTYRLGLTASKGGVQTISVIARSNMDASAATSAQFNVVAPSLRIAVDGPSLRYKGRHAKYTATVTNDGSLVNNNVHVSQSVPEGFKFLSADHQGKFDPATHMINWFVNRLEPGESTQVSCELQSLQLGDHVQTVQVVSDSGVQAEAKIETRVDGIASLTMEVVDRDDPVETGAETAYEIRIKNDGSKSANGVILTCELPAGMELLSTKSPVEKMAEGRQLIFQPIDEIAPGTQVTIRIQMKVNREGVHRLRARLNGGGLPEPMILEEVTRAYSDGSN